MTDREKKIAEIREKHSTGHYNYNYEIRDAIQFLLDELDHLEREYAEERAAHNAHVTELCELEQERNMYKASSEVFYERLKKVAEQRDKLIEVLRWYADAVNYEYRTSYLDQDAPIIDDSGQRARNILKEIGVEVEPDRLHDARVKIAKARFSPERLVGESAVYGIDCRSGRCEF